MTGPLYPAACSPATTNSVHSFETIRTNTRRLARRLHPAGRRKFIHAELRQALFQCGDGTAAIQPPKNIANRLTPTPIRYRGGRDECPGVREEEGVVAGRFVGRRGGSVCRGTAFDPGETKATGHGEKASDVSSPPGRVVPSGIDRDCGHHRDGRRQWECDWNRDNVSECCGA